METLRDEHDREVLINKIEQPSNLVEIEVILRVCKILGIKIRDKDLPTPGKEPDASAASRLLLAVLASMDDISPKVLFSLNQELQKHPEYKNFPNVEYMIIRMFRIYLRTQLEAVEKIIDPGDVKEDEKKRKKYTESKDYSRLFHLRLNSITSIATLVLLLVIATVAGTIALRADKKVQKWESEMENIRRCFAPFFQDNPENTSVSPAPASSQVPENTSSPPTPETERIIDYQKFLEKIIAQLRLPAEHKLLSIYLKHYDAQTRTLDEAGLRNELMQEIAVIDGNPQTLSDAVFAVTNKHLNAKQMEWFISELSQKIWMPSGPLILDIYSQEADIDKKREDLLRAIFAMSDNKTLIEGILRQFFS